jgi:orotate phosphoribosyltransferase-like protein
MMNAGISGGGRNPGRFVREARAVTDDRHQELEHVRLQLESIALLETAAARREGRVEEIMGFLESHGMTVDDLANELEISKESVRELLHREELKQPHERIGISETSVDSLVSDLQGVERSE